MVERAARAVYERIPNGGYVITGHGTAAHANDFRPDAWEDAPDRHAQCRDIASAVIEAIMEPTPEMIAAVDVLPGLVDQGRVYDAYDRDPAELSADAPELIWRAMLRTALSQPNDEGEGK